MKGLFFGFILLYTEHNFYGTNIRLFFLGNKDFFYAHRSKYYAITICNRTVSFVNAKILDLMRFFSHLSSQKGPI